MKNVIYFPIFQLVLNLCITHIDSIDFIFLGEGCPRDWSQFGFRCFKFFNPKKTWTMAELPRLRWNLASIHSDEENAFIHDLINGHAWLGGHDAVEEGVWMWTDGSSWDYTKWWDGEPNNVRRNEHSLMIYAYDTFWNDSPSYGEMGYICAKDLVGCLQ
uniref:C-type lectin domain-containing protein n=1 Tax=Neogobius melanostomus TaxID=47308 RepID=A0A8C6ULQ1_9GOBI